MENVTVIIPTMNRPKSLDETLRSIFSGTQYPAQLIVVDQSDSEEIQKENRSIVQQYDNKCLCEYLYQETPSLTKARNLGFNKSIYELVVFADDDILFEEETLINICKKMHNHEISMIAGVDLNSNGKSSFRGFLLGTRSFRKRNQGHVTLSMLGRFPDQIREETRTEWAMGFFFCVRKSLTVKWKLKWDENLSGYAYAEDLDFSYSYYKHSKEEGLRCVLVPDIAVFHMVSKEYRTPTRKSINMYVFNRRYLSRKHQMGWRSLVAINWCDCWKLVESILKRENPSFLFKAMYTAFKCRKQIERGHLKELY